MLRPLLLAGVRAVRWSAAAGGGLLRAAGAAGPGERLAETGAKVRIFELFRFADEAARSASGGRRTDGLTGAVAAALRLPAADAVWVLEGLGYSRGAGAARSAPVGEGPGVGLDRRWWIPLHTGTGMALGEEALEALRGRPRDEPDGTAHRTHRDRTLETLVRRCRRLSAPGYALATFEPFGFMARMLAPATVAPVARVLPRLFPGELHWAAAFQHGVGRSFYFSPFAVSGARALAAAWTGDPGDDPRWAIDRLTGAAWALALVQLPRPALVEAGLAAAERLPPEARPAIADGVASAVRLWHHGRGEDPVLRAFLGHPGGRAWQSLVAEPVRRALQVAGPPGSGRPGELFRHHPGGPP